MRTNTSRGVLAATVITLALVLAACGGGDGSDDASSEVRETTTTAASSGSTTPGNPDSSLPTGEEICTKVSAELVGTTLDLDITDATPSDPSADLPPACTYAYAGAGGKPATITITALRPLDMGGQTGAEGYKWYVGVNKEFAGDVDVEEVPVEIGRESVRFTSETTHVSISDTGKQVVQVTVPKADADAEQADALLVATVGAIG